MAFGREYIIRPSGWRRLARFGAVATAAALSPSSYGTFARGLALREIHATAWPVLPGYLAFTALLSLVVIDIVNDAAHRFGFAAYSLELVLRVLALEVVPLMTALFVALRSGAAIGVDVALMRVSGELQEEAEAGLDPLNRELVPRIAAAALSLLSLTILSCTLVVVITYFVYFHTSVSGLAIYNGVVSNVFTIPILIGFVLKCALFGLAVALIPLASGLDARPGEPKTVPYAMLAGLLKLCFFIGLIQVLSLVVKYV